MTKTRHVPAGHPGRRSRVQRRRSARIHGHLVSRRRDVPVL